MSIIDTITQIFPITEFQKKKKELYDNVYWPILKKTIIPTNFGQKEAWECAYFHAGMLPEFNLYKIVENVENDPWERVSGGVEEKQFLRAAGVYVVDNKTGAVYDHRVLYCIKEPWAFRLGFLNPIDTWNEMGAPEVNPYKGLKNAEANAFYGAKGVLKNRNGYVNN